MVKRLLAYLRSVTVYDLIHLAAKIEFAIFGTTFVLVILLVSIGAAIFILKTTLDHTFPGWHHTAERVMLLLM